MQQDESCNKVSLVSEHFGSILAKNETGMNSEEVLMNAVTSHKIYITISMVFTGCGCFLYLYLVSQNQNLYFVECPACRMSFFSNFYFYFFANFSFLVVCLKNLKVKFPQKQVTNLWVLNSTKTISGVFSGQMLFTLIVFSSQIYCCSTAISNVLADLFIFQLMQYTVQFFVNLFYNVKVYKEFETIFSPKALPTDSKESDNGTVEIFNASFALNETKSEANYNYLQNKNPEMTFKTDSSNNTNLSHFTNSNIDTTKIGTISADSCLNVSKFQVFKRSPRRKLNHVKEVDIEMD